MEEHKGTSGYGFGGVKVKDAWSRVGYAEDFWEDWGGKAGQQPENVAFGEHRREGRSEASFGLMEWGAGRRSVDRAFEWVKWMGVTAGRTGAY